MPRLSQFVAGLSVRALAGPQLTGRQRTSLLESPLDVTILNTTVFLAGYDDAYLGATFNTAARREQLATAWAGFLDESRSWRTGDRWSGKQSWILPLWMSRAMTMGRDADTLARLHAAIGLLRAVALARAVKGNRATLGLRQSALRYFDAASHLRLERCDSFGVWLPHLSVEGIRAAASLRASDRSELVVACALGMDTLGISHATRPWNPALPSRVRALPLTWLYQFAAKSRFEQVLVRLRQAGCTNLGHLVILHPELAPMLREETVTNWIALKMYLGHVVQAPAGAET